MMAERERGEGSIFKHPRSRFLWMRYSSRGKLYRESTGTDDPDKALKKLKAKIAEVNADRYGIADFVPNSRLKVRDLLDALEADYKLRGVKSIRSVQSHLKPLKDALGFIRAQHLTPERVDRYMEDRLAATEVEGVIVAGASTATVNRETQLLKQAYRLAVQRKKLKSVPLIRRLSEKGHERKGFFEKGQFEAVAEGLPEHLKDFARFGYLSGWRKSEIASLRWQDVDLMGRLIRLRPENAKNGTGRMLALEGELWQIIERQRHMRKYENDDKTAGISEYVFHRAGRPIGDFRKSWAATCKKAKVDGRLFHDLRRTAVRNMVRAGVPERVAMSISGHKTRAIFDRYNIVSEEDLRRAVVKTQEHLKALPSELEIEELHTTSTPPIAESRSIV